MSQTEEQKMLAGELYIASDPELVRKRNRAHYLCHLLNNSSGASTVAAGSGSGTVDSGLDDEAIAKLEGEAKKKQQEILKKL
ncbi:hypothetical protein HK102_010187, partial [Quaeritorhiza haematococci]